MTQYKAADLSDPAYFHSQGNAWADDKTATPAAALATTDTIDLMRVARGVRLQELFKTNGDFDTGATLAYNLGYRKVNTDGMLADNASYFAAAATDMQAVVTGAAPTRYAFAPITFSEDVFITLTPTTGAAGVSGTPSIVLYARGAIPGK